MKSAPYHITRIATVPLTRAVPAAPWPIINRAPPILGAERVRFHSLYEPSLGSMYDVSPDGQRFVIVRRR